MAERWPYSDDEMDRYFKDRQARRGTSSKGAPPSVKPGLFGIQARAMKRFGDPAKAQAAYVVSLVALCIGGFASLLSLYLLFLAFTLPSLQQIESPDLSLSTVAYTADGQLLARYHVSQNRSWVPLDSIAPVVVSALVATEDHRFYRHWGIDVFRTFTSVIRTILGDTQGGSTITQQLARNLYRDIGAERTVSRKMREWLTAVQIERRYTKTEILEMYLNTVEFSSNAFGIQAASRTFFDKRAIELDTLEAATLVGLQKAITFFNPIRNPENSKRRRNVVMGQMLKHGYMTRAEFDALRERPVVTNFQSSEIVNSRAPYFAMYVQQWLQQWGRENGHNIYSEGLVVYTTLDSRLQDEAQAAMLEEMRGLQAVVDVEWAVATGFGLGQAYGPYLERAAGCRNERDPNLPGDGTCRVDPFAHFWSQNGNIAVEAVRQSPEFRELTQQGLTAEQAVVQLTADEAFMREVKLRRTRLEAGLVGIEPRTGNVRVWVGGRDLRSDWYDHVATAKRQPGSTFKPFVYAVAVDNGYDPGSSIGSGPFTWVGTGPCAGQSWSPRNMGGGVSSLRAALAYSDNYVTGRLMTEVNPKNVIDYARRMGIETDLVPPGVRAECYMALSLGTSDVSLLELTTAYATFANSGIHMEPTVVTRIEDRYGNVLYEATPRPTEALSEETALTLVDMMRGGVNYGTAIRLRGQYGLQGYDLAAKTGTTQQNADGWFMIMHPDLVIGSWVGFNDRRIAFRSTWWGQGAHNAMFVTGNFMRRLSRAQLLDRVIRFPDPPVVSDEEAIPFSDVEGSSGSPSEEHGRVGW